MQLLVKKKKNQNTHTQKSQNKKKQPTNQPTHPQVPSNPEISIKQKRARNPCGPAPACEA